MGEKSKLDDARVWASDNMELVNYAGVCYIKDETYPKLNKMRWGACNKTRGGSFRREQVERT